MPRIFTSLLLALLSLPVGVTLLSHAVPALNKVTLGGVTRMTAPPTLSIQNIWNGKLQQYAERWFVRSLTVRPYLVKTDNQINYSLFGQLSSSQGGKAILGHGGHLIEKVYLKRAQGAFAPKRGALEHRAKELRDLRGALQELGKDLFIIISPNKPALYPEVIPSRYRLPSSERRVLRKEFSLMLREYELPHMVSHEILKTREEDFSYPLFAETGTHWSELGSCLIMEELLKELRKQNASFSGDITCSVAGERNTPLPIDRDLLSVANLWSNRSLLRPAPLIERKSLTPPKTSRTLFIGTSFLWALFYNFDKANIFQERDMYYYFRRSFPHPRGEERAIDRENDLWMERALKSDIFIFEVNEAFLHRIGYGFPKRMLEYLKRG